MYEKEEQICYQNNPLNYSHPGKYLFTKKLTIEIWIFE